MIQSQKCKPVMVYLSYFWSLVRFGLSKINIYPGMKVADLGLRKGYPYLSMLLSPAFSKKSGGTLFLVFRGAWCVVGGAWRVVRGAWRVARGSEFLVGTLSP